jgi:hypothetical protein
MNKTAVFILSANYSGSTWLALMLGSHSQAFYVGELNKMFHDEPVPCRLCEEKRRQCPFFHDIAQTKPRNIHELIFARSGKTLLVDNSKTIAWSKKIIPEDRFQAKYIHLLRDPRAIAYSLQLRHRPADLADWIHKNYEIRNYLTQNQLDYRVVTYNEVAERIDDTLADLCAWLGLAFEAGQKEYWNVEHHGAGRNGATAAFLEQHVASDEHFYADNRRTHFHDLRWKERLNATSVDAITHHTEMQMFLGKLRLQFSENGLVNLEDRK